MKNFSIGKGWLPFWCAYILAMYLTCNSTFAYTPPNTLKSKHYSGKLHSSISPNVLASTFSPAHSGSQVGYPSIEDAAKNKRCLSDSEFVYFQNRDDDGSPRVAGLDFFGTFFGNEKKYKVNSKIADFVQQQTITITGTITDNNGKLPGVSISVKGKQNVAISDTNGNYSIEAEATDVLIFSYVGYKTVEVPVNGQSTINFLMTDDATSLTEVTVNAGYYTVKEKERTGSIAKIKASDIEKQPVNNPLAAMQGRMAGVNITQNTGAPGGGFNIQIRGINSIRAEGNAPLYIVDGVPFSSQSVGDIQTSAGILSGTASPLNNINPGDIESIEVLKDADATAIYGSRGANGVVLITTKKGKEGKTKFSFSTFTGIATVTRTMDMMNTEQYLNMRREAFENDNIATYPANAYDVNGTWDQTRYTDWQKELIGGTAYTTNAQASVSGGSAATQFLLSGTWRRESTVFPGDSHYGKGAFHGSLTHKSTDEKFNLNFAVDYAADKNNLQATDLTNQAYTLAPNAPALYNDEGDLNWENGTFNNPLRFLKGRYLANTASLIANTMLSFKVLPNLIVKTSIGYNDTRVEESRTIPSTMNNPSFGVTSANSILLANNGIRKSWIAEPQISWNNEWQNGELNILVGATFQEQKSKQLSQMGTGFSSNILINSLAAATTVRVSNNQLTEYRYQAFFGRINYIHNKKYILNLTGRRDGSSRFGPGNRFANFGAVGAAWLFSEEKLIKDKAQWLSFGKLRASYGTTGNDQIGDYQYLDTYSVTANNYNGVIGLQPARLFNPDFGWETNKKLEIAAEFGMLKDRITFTTAWFRNKSSNQLVGIPLPATTGFSSIQANLDATVQNTGFEGELHTVNVRTANFSWSTSANITIPKNKLLEFKGLEGSTFANTYVIGESINIVKAYHSLGINPDTGLYKFEDYNNDGQISAPADRQYIVDLTPKWFGGFGNQFTYKNWEMDFLFQFVKQDGRNYLGLTTLPGAMANLPVEALNHYPLNGTGADVQQYSTGATPGALDAHFRYAASSAAFTDASYVRLKSMSISYRIPSSWSKTFSGKIYLQGQNLLTFTNYKGPDPENQSFTYLPPLKQYTLGLQLSF